jgi:uncharacterized protein involved in exopolysaccharide biosynthesis
MESDWRSSERDNPLNLASILFVLRRRRRLALLAFLTLFGAVSFLVMKLPVRYEAEMKLMLKRARTDGPVDIDKGAAAGVAGALSDVEIA